eukprot:3600689-Heterocapsa_arctica.AAC.1
MNNEEQTEPEAKEEYIGAMQNDMTDQEDINILYWLMNNKAMKEATEKEFDPECLKENKKINPQCQHLGTTIVDQLIGAPRTRRENKAVFDMKEHSMDNWVP